LLQTSPPSKPLLQQKGASRVQHNEPQAKGCSAVHSVWVMEPPSEPASPVPPSAAVVPPVVLPVLAPVVPLVPPVVPAEPPVVPPVVPIVRPPQVSSLEQVKSGQQKGCDLAQQNWPSLVLQGTG
jgi:hypothetical protein